jgi:4-amino-4-deoxy-L-arabinose transferase-like glycosyltransferase
VFGLVVAPFYIATTAQFGEGSLWYLLWSQGPGRVLGRTEFHDSTTPLYVLHTAAWALLPMSPLVGWAWWQRWQTRATKNAQPFHSVASWWLVTAFVGVAAAAYKLPQYVYWGAPAAALLAAEVVDRLPRWVSAALAFASTVLAAFVVVVMFPVSAGWAWGLLGAALAVPVLISWRSRTPVVGLCASVLGFLGLFDWYLHPSLLEYQPSREVALAVAQTENARELQLVGAPKSFSLDFYVSVPLVERSEAEVQPGLALVSSELAAHLMARSSVLGSWPTYRVSLPRWPFLRASTRAQAVSTVTLLLVRAPAVGASPAPE